MERRGCAQEQAQCSRMARFQAVVVDGTNGTFTLASTPSPASSLVLYRNGIAQKPAVDYTLTGATVPFLTGAIPQPGDTLLAWYRLPPGSSAD